MHLKLYILAVFAPPKEIKMENNFEKENDQLEAQNESADSPVTEPAQAPVSVSAVSSKKLPWWIIAATAVAIVAIVTAVVFLIPKYADYTITVIDEIGNPMSNVMVKFTDSEGASKTRITDKDGKVSFVEVRVGESTVKLEKGFSDAIILTPEYQLDKKTTSLRAIVCDETKVQSVYGDIPDESYAYGVGIGTYNIPSVAGKTTYLVFNANTSGMYKVSFVSDDAGMTVGHYGIPMYVQSTHTLDGEYDGKSFEITVQDTGTPHVIGLNCVSTTDAKLIIERINDAPFDPSYVDWQEIQAPADITKCDTTGKTLVSIDIANSAISVTLGEDGYYYTNTGKRVYVRITTATEYGKTVEGEFVPLVPSLAFLAGYVDSNIGMNVGGYIYDDSGNFVCKKKYNSLIETCMNYVDDTYGVVPLSADFAECIKLHGESSGWWDKDSETYLFDGIPANANNAWLFFCMVEQ